MNGIATRRVLKVKAPSFLLMALALTLALVLAVSACQSEDDPTAAPATDGASSETEQTPQDSGTDTGSDTSSSEAPAMDEDRLVVVATSNIVADWVKNIGGDRVEVISLLPIGGDPHTYQPGARDVAQIVDADLVLTVGLGLEGAWLEELIENASTDETRIVALADMVNPIEFAETGGHDEEEGMSEIVGRLLIADGEMPALSVLDLATGEIDEQSLPVTAPSATLYSSPSGRFVFSISRGPGEDAADDDRVEIFDGGIYLEPHDGHLDLVTEPVSRLTIGTTDQRPIHVDPRAGWTAIFHDATGRIAMFEEHELEEERNDYEPLWLEAGLQHGAGIPLGEGYIMVTTNNPDFPSVSGTSSLPLGAEIWTLDGTVVYDEPARACPGLHGNATNAHGTAFGCVGGVLFIEGHDGEYEYEFIENPAEMAESARIGSLWGHAGAEFLFGSATYRQEGAFVSDGLWLIDAEGGEMSRVLPAGTEKRTLRAAFDAHGEELFVLTYDGVLNVINPETGEVEEEHQLVDPFDGSTSPTFTVVGEVLYLSDRAGGRIIEFHLEEGEIEREWAISGQPRSLAFVGIGVAEEEGGHVGHDHGPLDPHFWFDPNRVENAVIQIATRLGTMDPAGVQTYTDNTTAYVAQLRELHGWAEQQIAEIPVDNRILVTSHDSLSYFAVVYGFEVVGTVIPGGTTETESSAEQLAELIEIVEHEGVPAIFGETTVTERIARAVAEETGAGFYSLYSGSLGAAGSGADTYLAMFRSNVALITEALQ